MKAVPFLDDGHLTFGPAYFTFLLLVVKINRPALIGFQAQLDTLYDISDTLWWNHMTWQCFTRTKPWLKQRSRD